MLKITNDGKHAALDPRLRVKNATDSPNNKVNVAIEHIYKIWEEYKKDRATQIVWCDLSIPKPGKWSIYQDIKSKLIKKGVPPAEIAFVHDIPPTT
jgi:hypothetical protein